MRAEWSDKGSASFPGTGGTEGHPARGAARLLPWAIPCALGLGVIACAMMLPGDANWDLRNYHIYNPFAFLHGRSHFDLVPASVQTFFSPLLDVPYYLLHRRVGGVPVLNALLAIPHAVAVVLSYFSALMALGTDRARARWLAAIAAIYGATGAAASTTLASTQSEMIPVALVLGAVLLALGAMVGPAGTGAPPRSGTAGGLAGGTVRRMAVCGLLCGAAAGLKLTNAYAVVGFAAGLLAWPGLSPRARVRVVLAFGAGALAGACAVGGYWWLTLYREFGNPLFPFYNHVFRSPWMLAQSVADTRFFPSTPLQWVAYPFYWAFTPARLVSETPVRDPRFALALLAVLAVLVRWAVWPPAAPSAASARERFLVAFFAVGFVLWEVQFSILRYLAGLELLTGTMVLLAARPWWRGAATPAGLIAAGSLCALVVAVTVQPGTERAAAAGKPVDVVFPPIPPDSVVLLLDHSPMAYTAAYAPRTVRFLGVGNWVVSHPEQVLFRERAQEILRRHTGPIWGMDQPGIYPGVPEATLAQYGLRRTPECTQVRSNLDGDGLRLCRLERAPG